VLAYLIAGHHSGLADWNDGLEQRLADPDSLQELQESLFASPPDDVLTPDGFTPDLRRIPGGAAGFALWVRMLFSCLVDADFSGHRGAL
jgi:CRISPR-associated endonuclease/helicase Cas3